jgi:6-phosphofructokinase 1
LVVSKVDEKSPDPIKLGGVGNKVALEIEKLTGTETRVTVLGHLQRGGSPTPYDRILSTRFGTYAIELAIKKRFDRMVALKGSDIISVKIEDAIKKQKLVTKNNQTLRTANAVGVSFGTSKI